MVWPALAVLTLARRVRAGGGTARATRPTWSGTGDTLSSIAGRVFGDAKRWREILKENPQVTNANRIYPGDALLVPVPRRRRPGRRAACGARGRRRRRERRRGGGAGAGQPAAEGAAAAAAPEAGERSRRAEAADLPVEDGRGPSRS